MPAASSHRFERDLRAIREARDVELSAVQQETRIPADVLDRFETGRLVGDPHYNEVYLKNLLKAYAAAVGLPPSEVVASYQAAKDGSYAGELRKHLQETDPAGPPPLSDHPSAESSPSEDDAPQEGDVAPESPTPASGAPPAVAALRQADQPPVPAPPKHEAKARVRSRETVTSSTSGIDASWGLIIGGTLVVLLLIGGALYLMIRPDRPDVVPQEQPVAVAPDEVDAEAEPDAVPDEPAALPDSPQLQLPIQVTVIAQDGALGGAGGFRVTEEPDVRRPYWIEQGVEQTFSSDSLVVIWGVETAGDFGIPAEARLRMQGYTWNPPTGSVLRIDPQRGQALLDSLHRVQAAPSP